VWKNHVFRLYENPYVYLLKPKVEQSTGHFFRGHFTIGGHFFEDILTLSLIQLIN
jgi:hypothetical protein